MEIYVHNHAAAVRKLHSNLLVDPKSNQSLGSFIEAYAQNLLVGFRVQNQAVFTDISNYYKPLMGKIKTEVFQLKLDDSEFLDIAASVHGFESFKSIGNKEEDLDHDFLLTVDTMLKGEIDKLDEKLSKNPSVNSRHSQFGHKAQLIHYCASNALEIYRQVVPSNLLEIIQLLLKHGADPKVKIPVYGGHFDFFELFSSSAHPKESGVDKAIYQYFSES